jgi:hypothetical protein
MLIRSFSPGPRSRVFLCSRVNDNLKRFAKGGHHGVTARTSQEAILPAAHCPLGDEQLSQDRVGERIERGDRQPNVGIGGLGQHMPNQPRFLTDSRSVRLLSHPQFVPSHTFDSNRGTADVAGPKRPSYADPGKYPGNRTEKESVIPKRGKQCTITSSQTSCWSTC